MGWVTRNPITLRGVNMDQSTTYLEKNPTKYIFDSLKNKAEAPPEGTAIPLELVEIQTDLEVFEAIEEVIENETPPTLDVSFTKKYFRIREVAEMLGVDASTLRHWENQCSAIRPRIVETGHRIYSIKDIQLFHQFNFFVNTRNLSFEEAKKKVLKNVRQKSDDGKKLLRQLSVQLKEIIHLLRTDPGIQQ